MLHFIVAGLVTGSIYALVALGFNIVFKSADAINFTQGEWVMAGGMTAAALSATLHLPLIAVVPLAALIVGALGIVSERLAVYPLRQPTAMTITLITVGLAIATKALVTLVLGKAPMGLPQFTAGSPVGFGGLTVERQALWIIAGMLAVFIALQLLFDRTLFGKALKAAAADRMAAGLVGINVARTVMWAFGLAALAGALGGIIMTPLTLTSFNAGTVLGFKGFSAAMLGGLGNVSGAVVGGLLLGVFESVAAGVISSEYKDAVAFVVLLAVLFLRPQGLLGRAAAGGSK